MSGLYYALVSLEHCLGDIPLFPHGPFHGKRRRQSACPHEHNARYGSLQVTATNGRERQTVLNAYGESTPPPQDRLRAGRWTHRRRLSCRESLPVSKSTGQHNLCSLHGLRDGGKLTRHCSGSSPGNASGSVSLVCLFGRTRATQPPH